MESLPLFSDASFEKLQDSDETEESIVIDDPRDHQEQQNRDEAEKLSYTGSAIGDIAIFRDFFLAAFSDGYYNLACCGSDSVLSDAGCLSYSSAKSAPMNASAASNNNVDIRRTASSHSQHSDLQLNFSASQEGTAAPRRKRPLAVAVGCKYAEDRHGRPIVITPGNRRMLVLGKSSSPTSSPFSRPVITPLRDISPTLLFPSGYDAARSRKEISLKASLDN